MTLGAALIIGAGTYAHRAEVAERRALADRPSSKGFAPIEPAVGGVPGGPSGFRTVRLGEPLEHDLRSRIEILERRRARVNAEPELLEALGGRRWEYTPSDDVFGGMAVERAWSEQAPYLENPYLLVAASEVWAQQFPDGQAI